MIQIKRILAPTDFSECADHALTYAAELAQKFAAELIVVYVIPDLSTMVPDAVLPVPYTAPDMDEMLKTARDALISRVTEKNLAHLNPRADVRVGGTANEIIEAAKDSQADLIVIGTHGRSGLAHLLLGSVAEKVIRNAPCPVLTVR